MKWTVAQLRRKQHHDNRFSDTLDLRGFIPEGGDILDISPVKVEGEYRVEADRSFRFDLVIDAVFVIACARTLEAVEVPLHIEVTETFSETAHPEHHPIEGITVDLSPIIWSNIYLEKPLRVVKPGAKFESDAPENGKKPESPMFDALKKYKKDR